MGGKEGSRGYLYQSIATVMDTVLDEKWKEVEVEPDTENDKVDILWIYENNEKKVVQVKSSENNISRADIINWLKELIDDVKDAKEYKLMLIGNCNDKTATFITKINKRNFTDEEDKDLVDLNEIKDFISKIKIQLDNFQLVALEAQIHQNVSKLLAKMGHVLHPSIIDQITGAMVYQFSKFSTNGTRISREKYIERIQEWAYYNYPEIKGQGMVKKALEIAFYYKGLLDFSNKIRAISLPVNELNPFRENLKQNVNEIRKYMLPSKKQEMTDKNSLEKKHLATAFQATGINEFKYDEISDFEKEEFIKKIKDLLDEDVEKSFFYVGNLKTRRNIFTDNIEVNGTEKEKEKGKLLDKFLMDLYEYEHKYSYFKYFESLYLIPLVLRNNGQSYDKDMEINIKIPSDVELITKESMRIPNSSVIEEFIGSEGYLEYMLMHPRDYQLEEYMGHFRAIPMRSDFHRVINVFPDSKEIERIKIEKFEDYLDKVFDFEIYEETDQTILKYYFRELNAKKNMAFPAFLMVKADKTFHIEYEITSKHLGNKIIGELIYEIN